MLLPESSDESMEPCPFCGKELLDAAVVCRHCGRELVQSVRAKKPWRIGRWLLVAIAVLLFWQVAKNVSRSDKQAAALEATRVPDEVTAVEMLAAYDENAVAAGNRYQNRLLAIHGRVKEIGRDARQNSYLLLGDNPDSIYGIQAIFPADQETGLATLQKGALVTVICDQAEKMAPWVYVRHCRLE
jgi:hypothetical protein